MDDSHDDEDSLQEFVPSSNEPVDPSFINPAALDDKQLLDIVGYGNALAAGDALYTEVSKDEAQRLLRILGATSADAETASQEVIAEGSAGDESNAEESTPVPSSHTHTDLANGTLPQLDELGSLRRKLFTLDEPVVLTPAQHEQYWPYVDNIWCGSGHKPFTASNQTRSFGYQCRLGRKQATAAPKIANEARRRNRNVFITPNCPARMVLVGTYEAALEGEDGAQRMQTRNGQSHWVRPVSFKFHAQGNSQPHNHPIEDSDRRKLPSAIRRHGGDTVARATRRAAAKAGLEGDRSQPTSLQHVFESGGRSLMLSDVFRAARGFRKSNPDPRYRHGEGSAAIQWRELDQWLQEGDFLTSNVSVHRQDDGALSRATVFMARKRVELLQRFGFLATMDTSAHKTNWLGWKSFTIMVRDDCGEWRAAAHLLTEFDDGDIIGSCLKQVKEWCHTDGDHAWKLRYWLTGDSVAHQRASEIAFSDLPAGDTEVHQFLCRRHVSQTFQPAFPEPRYKTFLRHLHAALFLRKSSTGCNQSLRNALGAVDAQDTKARDYVERSLYVSKPRWAHYARRQSPVLLQTTTTKSNDSFHEASKRADHKQQMASWSLKGTAKHVLDIAEAYDQRAAKAALNFRSTEAAHPLAATHPWLRRLPTPVQKLVGDELRAGEQDYQDGDFKELKSETRCGCLFNEKWLMVCRHIWAHHLLAGNLKDTVFERWIQRWEENGFDVFFTTDKALLENGNTTSEGQVDSESRRQARSTQLNETLTSLQDKYHSIEEGVAELQEPLRSQIVDRWLARMKNAISPICQNAVVAMNADAQTTRQWQTPMEIGLSNQIDELMSSFRNEPMEGTTATATTTTAPPPARKRRRRNQQLNGDNEADATS